MTTLYRLRSIMTGFPGGPGVATMYFLDANTAAASVSAFWNNLMNVIPADVSITPEAFGDAAPH